MLNVNNERDKLLAKYMCQKAITPCISHYIRILNDSGPVKYFHPGLEKNPDLFFDGLPNILTLFIPIQGAVNGNFILKERDKYLIEVNKEKLEQEFIARGLAKLRDEVNKVVVEFRVKHSIPPDIDLDVPVLRTVPYINQSQIKSRLNKLEELAKLATEIAEDEREVIKRTARELLKLMGTQDMLMEEIRSFHIRRLKPPIVFPKINAIPYPYYDWQHIVNQWHEDALVDLLEELGMTVKVKKQVMKIWFEQ